MKTQPPFLEDIIDDSVEMRVLHPVVFDDYLAEGWRLLGRSIVRHNFSMCRGKICHTIPLRIRLPNFEPSKSQRQLLRRNRHLEVRLDPIRLGPAKQALFELHSRRFNERRPDALASFLSQQAHREPVAGSEFSVYDRGELIASSYFHLGEQGVSGTYCVYDPDYTRYSLGTYTMLLELLYTREIGKQFYYHGYCYDVPSAFDYKLNFNQLEAMNWRTGDWYPLTRVPVRQWSSLVAAEENIFKNK
jgi:arginyl-tRNA--protein-N-Asp/Glu arginylyltransferase